MRIRKSSPHHSCSVIVGWTLARNSSLAGRRALIGSSSSSSSSSSSFSTSSSSSSRRNGSAGWNSRRWAVESGHAAALSLARTAPRRSFHASRFLGAKKDDYYKTLGVEKDAPISEIKKKYFQLAKKYHPDTNKDNAEATEKFQAASEAYEVLSDTEKRQVYDQFGHAGLDGNAQQQGGNPFGQGGFGGGGAGGFGGRGMSMDDIFEELFTGRRRGPRKGQNMTYQMRMSFMDAVHGKEETLKFQFQQQRGPGQRPELVEREAKVVVPPGVSTGMSLSVPGQGADGDPGMPRGDLFVELQVERDSYFQRDPQRIEDVHVTVPMTLSQAVLGGKIDVLTLDGMVKLKVPSGSQPNQTLIMRGKGIRRINAVGRGNQYVNLELAIPRELTPRQRELMEEFASEEEEAGKQTSFANLVQRTLKRLSKYIGGKDEKAA